MVASVFSRNCIYIVESEIDTGIFKICKIL